MAVMNAAGVVAGGALGMAQAFGTAYAVFICWYGSQCFRHAQKVL